MIKKELSALKPILMINSSGSASVVCLINHQTRNCLRAPASQNHSQIVLKIIDHALHERQMRLADLEGIIVITGPGSFTGVKIGIAIANALAWSLGIKVAGIPLKQWRLGFTIQQDILTKKSQSIVLPTLSSPHITCAVAS